jgi:hypothetical protein
MHRAPSIIRDLLLLTNYTVLTGSLLPFSEAPNCRVECLKVASIRIVSLRLQERQISLPCNATINISLFALDVY